MRERKRGGGEGEEGERGEARGKEGEAVGEAEWGDKPEGRGPTRGDRLKEGQDKYGSINIQLLEE